MAYPPGKTYSVSAGDTILAAHYETLWTNIQDGLTPETIDDYSASVGEMQATTDPYPGASASQATTLDGELQRLRYQQALTSGKTYWYEDPDTSIAQLANSYQQQFHNLTLTATVAAKALTVALKTQDGGDPTTTDIARIIFRNSTLTTGTYVARTVTSALSVVLSSGSTLGFTAALAGRIYVWAIDNAGTVELALSRTADLYPESNLISTTAEGGAGAADSASVMYSTTARTNVPCRCLGYINITTGAVAGEWDNAPTAIQLMGAGVRRTGDIVQTQITQNSAVNTGTTIMQLIDTIPPNTEGDEYLTVSITPNNAINKLKIEASALVSLSINAASAVGAIFQDTTANALKASTHRMDTADTVTRLTIYHEMTAGTASSTTFKLRLGPSGAGTLTFNGTAGGRLLGGVASSYIKVTEIMA